MHPLKAYYKGQTAYTDKLERAHPGTFASCTATRSGPSAIRSPLRTWCGWWMPDQICQGRSGRRHSAMRWTSTAGSGSMTERRSCRWKKTTWLKIKWKRGRSGVSSRTKQWQSGGNTFYRCFFDKMWLYTIFHRRKIKVLPPGLGENVTVVVLPSAHDGVPAPHYQGKPVPIDCWISFTALIYFKCVSSKVMFLGVVTEPIESWGFNGNMFIEQVVKYDTYKKSVYYQ